MSGTTRLSLTARREHRRLSRVDGMPPVTHPKVRRIGGVARFLAERGHHVVVQSCRGTFGSGGAFDPLHHEVADGQAAMRWVRRQHWATGRVHSWGGSYFGVTQWAYCDGDQRPDAMGIAISARRFDDAILYPGGGFSIDTPLTWAYALDIQEKSRPRPCGRRAARTPPSSATGSRTATPETRGGIRCTSPRTSGASRP
jgi:predicted acyl esterase